MAGALASLVKFFSPRTRGVPKGVIGVSSPPTFRPGAPMFRQVAPFYGAHLIDISEYSRAADSNQLMELMFHADPDVSAAVNAYLTVADTEPHIVIKDVNGEYHPEAMKLWPQLLAHLTQSTDLSQGYQAKPSLRVIAEQLRTMSLMRGACSMELVVDQNLVPYDLRHVDPLTIRWYERKPGLIKPEQWPRGALLPLDLDIPTFFFSHYRGSPLSNYAVSPFVATINTIVARINVINCLYKIMNLTGFPRIDIKVLEDVLRNSAPEIIKADPTKLRAWIAERINELRGAFTQIKPDEAFIHTDALEISMINEKSSGSQLNVDSIIKVLNAQNQAGLKTMSTILGRGESGVNTSTVEARLFSMNADSLNGPVSEVLSKVFSCAYQILGYPVFVSVVFPPSELRPATELEPQLLQKQTRLLELLSRGMITDEEFHLQLLGRMPPASAPKLSGTNFLVLENNMLTDASTVATATSTPNPNPAGDQPSPTRRAVTAEGGNNAKSNSVGGPGSAQDRK